MQLCSSSIVDRKPRKYIYGCMGKYEIVDALAEERRVETMVCKIAHQALSADLKDLSQMVYMILLDYDEEKLVDLYEHDQINFFLARIILNQYRSNNSTYYKEINRYRKMIDEGVSLTDYEE